MTSEAQQVGICAAETSEELLRYGAKKLRMMTVHTTEERGGCWDRQRSSRMGRNGKTERGKFPEERQQEVDGGESQD